MFIKLPNRYLVPLVPFLQNMKLKGEHSRARSKFLALASSALTGLHESELELIKEYAVLDGEGNPIIEQNGRFTLRDGVSKDYLAERNKLFTEVAEIEGGTYTSHLETMARVLREYDVALEGEDAELYDALYDAFEEALGNAG